MVNSAGRVLQIDTLPEGHAVVFDNRLTVNELFFDQRNFLVGVFWS